MFTFTLPAALIGFGTPATGVQFAVVPSVALVSRVKPAADAVHASVSVLPSLVVVIVGLTTTVESILTN